MVVEAVETAFGIPYRREDLPAGHIEPLKLVELEDDALGEYSIVTSEALVLDEDEILVRDRNFPSRQWKPRALRGDQINEANLGRRRFLFLRTSLRWRPSSEESSF